jgi:cytochrome P450
VFYTKAEQLGDVYEGLIDGQGDEGIEIFATVSRATLDIIGLGGFGYDFNSINNPDETLANAYATLFSQKPKAMLMRLTATIFPSTTFLPVRSLRGFREAKNVIRAMAVKLVREKQVKSSRDILSLMIEQNKRVTDEKDALSEEEMVNQVTVLLAAGHETTSLGVIWGLYLLATHKDIQTTLRKEVATLSNSATFDEIEACHYLGNVVKEILRFIPPLNITSRHARENDELNGVFIPKGTELVIPIYAMNLDSVVWGPDSETFNPNRWNNLPETVTNYSYLTFIQGPRSCIARKFAETEMKYLIAGLIKRFLFDESHKAGKIVQKAILSSRPQDGMYLQISRV